MGDAHQNFIDELESDTDRDGLPDFLEKVLNTDPTKGDTDGDGLADSLELRLGTNPRTADTDGDGEDDKKELAWGSNPRGSWSTPSTSTGIPRDSDRDGLTDVEERQYGTYSNRADSDSDGLDDGEEVLLGTEPTWADTDSDGLGDREERDAGTNPHIADTDRDGHLDGSDVMPFDRRPDRDNDGLSDADEERVGTSSSDRDTDDDGLLDGQEVAIGTNPHRYDTDGDGLNDWVEVGRADRYGLALDAVANNPDFDGDGLSDGEEYTLRTKWDEADTDGDGIDDGTELAAGTLETMGGRNNWAGVDDAGTPIVGSWIADEVASGMPGFGLQAEDLAAFAAGFNDSDGDGVTDGEEAILGTDPRSNDTPLAAQAADYGIDDADRLAPLLPPGGHAAGDLFSGGSAAPQTTRDAGGSDDVDSGTFDPDGHVESDYVDVGSAAASAFNPRIDFEDTFMKDSDRDGVTDWAESNAWVSELAVLNEHVLGDTDGDGVSDLEEAMSTDPTVAADHGLVAADDEMFAVPQPALEEDGTGSLNGQPTPPEPDDLLVVEPPPPPVLVEEAVQGMVVLSGAGELNGQPTPPTPAEPDDILSAPLADVPGAIVEVPYLVDPLHLDRVESLSFDQPDMDALALDEF